MKRFAGIVQPSFWEGMARIVDIGGTLQDELVLPHRYRKSGTHARASAARRLTSIQIDVRALTSDWNKVSRDTEVSAKRLAGKYL